MFTKYIVCFHYLKIEKQMVHMGNHAKHDGTEVER